MLDHMKFNKEDYYPTTKIIAGYVNTELIGRVITYSKYKVGWYQNGMTINAYNGYTINSHLLQWNKPDEIGGLASTGEIRGVAVDQNHIPYYLVNFDHWINNSDTGDGIYTTFIKASDIMTKNLSRRQL
ncbi:hypothetical protein [Lactobacillus crispatus]|uniref:hypothetical protein n=1 Tax=Lactobacillus crispatus TaxID=47770 RepID=UPI0020598F1C|nr:hypothetical protein [Lactobacillus crispatus]WEB33831.1 hypothetical protein PUW44_06270 [Lactobacillus crispatus]DAQ70483.1 MAG TPA: hypothetical protein [Caudoviricetes sp.]